jgi:uncharacterized protein involved in exopolysaccharide biosynthesis
MITRNTSNVYTDETRGNTGPHDLFRALFRHKRKMATFFCGTMTLVVVGLILFPRSYTSDARLFVRLGKESVALDPTATLNQTVNVSETRESEINSALEILRSRVLLEDVVERLGADAILNEKLEGETGVMDLLFVPVRLAQSWVNGGIGPNERAITELEQSLNVASPRRSNIIVVKCSAANPELAQRIVQAFLDSYMVRHLEANQTSGSHDFFVDQSKLLYEQLENATKDLRDAKNRTKFVSLEGKRENVQTEVNSIENAMLLNERALASAEAKVTALKQSLAGLPPKLMSEEAETANAATDSMRADLYKLEILEKEAASHYTSEHPKMIALHRQLAETEKIFLAQQPVRSHGTKRLSVVHQGVQTELMAAQALAASHRAEAELLAKQLDAVQSKIRSVNDLELEVTQLERKVDLLTTSYRSYSISREQARIDQALAAGRISNINVVQPASLLNKPSNPPIRLTMVLGFVLATLGSVLVALGAEYLDRSVKSPEQIEHELGMPVLFSVPRGTLTETVHN